MLRTLLASAAVALLAATASAQSCSNLTIGTVLDPTGSTTTVSIDVTGSIPDSLTMMGLSSAPGTTVFAVGPLGQLTLGLESPVAFAPLGMTDSAGDVSLSFDVPSMIGVDIASQAVGFGVTFGGGPPSLTFCTSNVVETSL
jgi:hypothetical protein